MLIYLTIAKLSNMFLEIPQQTVMSSFKYIIISEFCLAGLFLQMLIWYTEINLMA